MSNSKLIELSYYDPSAQVRLSAYADTLVLDHDQNGSIISAIRFGGYPEMVRAMADAIYGGATIEAAQNDTTRMLQSSLKSYQRQITHDGIYAVATLIAADTVREDDRSGKHEKDEDTNLVDTEQMELQPRRCYVFCPAGDQRRLFEELDRKTAAPLILEFQDYVLNSLRQRGDLRQLEVISLKERIDAWVLDLKPQDQNVVEVLERGLQSGDIQIPGAVPNMPDGFENVENVTGYLNTFGVTVADRIRSQFMPLFDPAKEPLSDEVLAINDCIMSRVGYSLYDAQLAVAEAVKRQLARKRVALIIRELLKHDQPFRDMWDAVGSNARIAVQQYRFRGGKQGEELGDENHFALMRAYDRALSDEDGSTFVERDDVDWLDDFELTKDDLADGK